MTNSRHPRARWVRPVVGGGAVALMLAGTATPASAAPTTPPAASTAASTAAPPATFTATPPAASTAAASACGSAPRWVDSVPDSVNRPSAGVTVRTWHGTAGGAPLALTAVEVDPSRARLGFSTAATVSTSLPTATLAARAHALAGINAGYFDRSAGGTSARGVQVRGGHVLTAPRFRTRATGIGTDGRIHTGFVVLDASVTVRTGNAVSRLTVGAVNDTAMPGLGLNVRTAYGADLPRRAAWYVLVRNGVVVRSGATDPGRPRGNDLVLLAPPALRNRLAAVRPGARITFAAKVRTPDGAVLRDAGGSGAAILSGGAISADCGVPAARTSRPRSALAWNRGSGRAWLVTVNSIGSGRAAPGNRGLPYGAMADVLRRIGATDGVLLDGGGSTTLVVKRGSKLVRADAKPSARQTRVADAIVVLPR